MGSPQSSHPCEGTLVPSGMGHRVCTPVLTRPGPSGRNSANCACATACSSKGWKHSDVPRWGQWPHDARPPPRHGPGGKADKEALCPLAAKVPGPRSCSAHMYACVYTRAHTGKGGGKGSWAFHIDPILQFEFGLMRLCLINLETEIFFKDLYKLRTNEAHRPSYSASL